MNQKLIWPSGNLSLSRKDDIYLNNYCPTQGLAQSKFSVQSKSHSNELVNE